jgi:D-alanyl-D-alanine dipeptidase
MTTTTHAKPVPFTRDDYAARMTRVVSDAAKAGLDGVVVTPGPDLVWLTGYRPTAITERLTVLVLAPGREPTLLVPALERPDAEGAEGASALNIADWPDGSDPYPLAGRLLSSGGRFGISDSHGRCTCSASARPPGAATALTQTCPCCARPRTPASSARLAWREGADATYRRSSRFEATRDRGQPERPSAREFGMTGRLHRRQVGPNSSALTTGQDRSSQETQSSWTSVV